MARETEHKYLVTDGSYKSLATRHYNIMQGYLCTDVDCTVRVRVRDNEAFITVKGRTVGDTRAEYEYPIPAQDAIDMLMTLCLQPVIVKTRYIVEYHGMTWEIDEFGDQLDGLVLAEIELPSSNASYDLPPFVGQNVTDDPRYYNSNLITKK